MQVHTNMRFAETKSGSDCAIRWIMNGTGTPATTTRQRQYLHWPSKQFCQCNATEHFALFIFAFNRFVKEKCLQKASAIRLSIGECHFWTWNSRCGVCVVHILSSKRLRENCIHVTHIRWHAIQSLQISSLWILYLNSSMGTRSRTRHPLSMHSFWVNIMSRRFHFFSLLFEFFATKRKMNIVNVRFLSRKMIINGFIGLNAPAVCVCEWIKIHRFT